MRDDYAALSEAWAGAEDLPAEIEARLSKIEEALGTAPEDAFDPADIAYAGAMVILGHDGAVRIERGLIRPEDAPPTAPEGGTDSEGGGEDGAPPWDEEAVAPVGDTADADEPEGDASAPLTARLVADLTAHRSWTSAGLARPSRLRPTVWTVLLRRSPAPIATRRGRLSCRPMPPTSGRSSSASTSTAA